MSGFLLNTNIISELVKPRPDANVTAWIQDTDESLLFLSVLTLGEIRRGIAVLPQSRRRATLESWLEMDLRARFEGRILTIDSEVADRWGLLTAAAGKLCTKSRNQLLFSAFCIALRTLSISVSSALNNSYGDG